MKRYICKESSKEKNNIRVKIVIKEGRERIDEQQTADAETSSA
jgi:hypothetical protein